MARKGESKYAAKQGRAKNGEGGGPRTRWARTSPFHDAYKPSQAHRLAQAHAEGEAFERLCRVTDNVWTPEREALGWEPDWSPEYVRRCFEHQAQGTHAAGLGHLMVRVADGLRDRSAA